VKVFVTGATGFVGSHLTRALVERDDEVVCLVRDLDRARQILGDAAPKLVCGNLNDRDTLRSACENADIVYHSAGLTTARSRDGFFAVNADATQRLVEAVADSAPRLTRFVYISSQAAAGPSRTGQPRTENETPAAVSNYGESKLAGEDRVRDSGLPWTIVRPCAVYGPGDRAFLTVFKMVRMGIMPVLGSARQELSLVHISDLVRSLLQILIPITVSETYFVCHPEIVTAHSLCKNIGAALSPDTPKEPLVFGLPSWAVKTILTLTDTAAGLAGNSTFLSRDKGNEYLAEAWVCSPGKLEAATGWRAETPAEEGVRDTVRWYRENGWL
jgi:nucleoside-diphosphate-sugar epimerase